MESKTLTWVFIFIGSTIGGSIPLLWGAGELSFSSIFFGGVGAIAGIYLAFKATR